MRLALSDGVITERTSILDYGDGYGSGYGSGYGDGDGSGYGYGDAADIVA